MWWSKWIATDGFASGNRKTRIFGMWFPTLTTSIPTKWSKKVCKTMQRQTGIAYLSRVFTRLHQPRENRIERHSVVIRTNRVFVALIT